MLGTGEAFAGFWDLQYRKDLMFCDLRWRFGGRETEYSYRQKGKTQETFLERLSIRLVQK